MGRSKCTVSLNTKSKLEKLGFEYDDEDDEYYTPDGETMWQSCSKLPKRSRHAKQIAEENARRNSAVTERFTQPPVRGNTIRRRMVTNVIQPPQSIVHASFNWSTIMLLLIPLLVILYYFLVRRAIKPKRSRSLDSVK